MSAAALVLGDVDDDEVAEGATHRQPPRSFLLCRHDTFTLFLSGILPDGGIKGKIPVSRGRLDWKARVAKWEIVGETGEWIGIALVRPEQDVRTA